MSPEDALGRFAALERACPLPAEVAAELHVEVVHIARAGVHLVGIAAACGEECLTGSAAALVEFPVERAYMELVERISTVEAMSYAGVRTLLDGGGNQVGCIERGELFPETSPASGFAWSRSNGVAVGKSYSDAATRARAELVERDRVLRSWFGGRAPRPVLVPGDPVLSDLTSFYDFEAVEFDAESEEPDEVHVAGLLALPRGDAPFAYGFGAARQPAGAVAKALRECLQGIGFLWGEEMPVAAPLPSPTPSFHQEHYLVREHHDQLRRWVAGEHERLAPLLRPEPVGPPTFVDLTPRWLTSGLRVVKALPRGHVPLAFGRGHPLILGEVPPHLAVHPIA